MRPGEPVTIRTLLKSFLRPVLVTWTLTLVETALIALVPLFIGFAIDGLLAGENAALWQLVAVLGALVLVSVLRRLYDTRQYGTIRVDVGRVQAERSADLPVSTLNARLSMGRELVDFLEHEVPDLMDSAVQLVVSLVVLYFFHPALSFAALSAGILMIALYGLSHRRFYRLNAHHNQQMERQVRILERKRVDKILGHLYRLRLIEVKLSDTEAIVYGAIFIVLLGFVVFNIWLSATHIETTVGTIFAIVTYSWQFVDSALVLPVTLQGWSRLSEIMHRINKAA